MPDSKLPTKKTKIICTIGPASQDQETLKQMIANGMNIARINFAHGDLETHGQTIRHIRQATAAVGERVTIMGDLPGPKMRIGKLAEEPVELERGQTFVLQTNEMVGNQDRVSIDFPSLPDVVKSGDRIFMNDGYVQLQVERIEGQEVYCTVDVGGELRSNKGVNFPGVDLGISAFTDRDREFLAFAAEQSLDAISQSFVRRPEDITAVREAAAELDYDPLIIAKIERAGAVDSIKAILQVTDGIMVARGDLGVEIPIEQIPATQKSLIQQANLVGKPVITATQMLESMIGNRRPTRAEVTDVANAILDGTDCVMLSGETAIGRYPAETVAVMARVAQVTEMNRDIGIGDLLELQEAMGEIDRQDLISFNIFRMAQLLDPAVVFVPSLSGSTARRLTRFRLPQWIIAPSNNEAACQRLQFSYGVYPVYVPDEALPASPEERRRYAQTWLKQHNIKGDLVLLIEGSGTLRAEDTKRIDIIDID